MCCSLTFSFCSAFSLALLLGCCLCLCLCLPFRAPALRLEMWRARSSSQIEGLVDEFEERFIEWSPQVDNLIATVNVVPNQKVRMDGRTEEREGKGKGREGEGAG